MPSPCAPGGSWPGSSKRSRRACARNGSNDDETTGARSSGHRSGAGRRPRWPRSGATCSRTLARYMSGRCGEWRETAGRHGEAAEPATCPPASATSWPRCSSTRASPSTPWSGSARNAAQAGPPGAAADVSWHDVTDEMARDDDAGMALWERIKQTARDELRRARGAAAIEGYQAADGARSVPGRVGGPRRWAAAAQRRGTAAASTAWRRPG